MAGRRSEPISQGAESQQIQQCLFQLHSILYHVQSSPQWPRPPRAPLRVHTAVLWPLTTLPLSFSETHPLKTPKVRHSFGSALILFSSCPLARLQFVSLWRWFHDLSVTFSKCFKLNLPETLILLRRLSKELQCSSFTPCFSFFPDSYTSHHSSTPSSAHLLKGLFCYLVGISISLLLNLSGITELLKI